MKRGALIVAAVAAAVAAPIAAAAPGGSSGPSSSQDPYLVRTQPGVVFKSILTTGDTVPKAGGGSYRMVGIPDGLGAFDNGDGTFTLLMNHELPDTTGIARAHGGNGAFVSKWVIRKDDLSVVSGQDLIQHVNLWTAGAYAPGVNVKFNRFCSADLPAKSALFNAATGKGFDGRLFLNGEESAGGRASLTASTARAGSCRGSAKWRSRTRSPTGAPVTGRSSSRRTTRAATEARCMSTPATRR